MSKSAVLQLIEAAESNPTLLQELQNAQQPETIITIASKLGYKFSEPELLDVMQEKKLSFASGEELSEEQLEAVVGGKGDQKRTYETKADNIEYTNGKIMLDGKHFTDV